MAKPLKTLFSKPWRPWTLGAIAILIGAFFGYRYWKAKQSAVPEGIAWGNGRIESKEVDVSAKLPLRVKEVLVAEGDLVKRGQVVARMDSVTLEAELAENKAALAAAREQLAVANAGITRQKSQIDLAKVERERAGNLVKERAGSQREFDVRKTAVQTTTATLAEEKAKLQVATEQVAVAEANVATTQTRIDDATLVSPVIGRVLYRLAEPGEVLAAGGRVLTLVNLEDVYMEIFLPAAQAARVKLGAEARLTVDYEPGKAAAGYVSFVSPEAQFTPKEVETKSEREKLMFRVKIQVPREFVMHYVERIKTGVRGVGYVKVQDATAWPPWLQNLAQPEPAPASTSTSAPVPTHN